MTTTPAIIELNDCELKLSHNGGRWRSSGFATLDGQEVVFGERARCQARLRPLVSFSRYWNQLGLSAVEHGNERFRHYADFAYHQLMELQHNAPHCKEVILAVPSSFNKEQLSLLLGICNQCPMKVIGVVDSAAISVLDYAGRGRYLHLDMQLHQCLLSDLSLTDTLSLQGTDIIAGTGLINLYQHWAKYLCGEFVRQCRFDPMHEAQSEQALYDLLPQLLNNSAQEIELSLQGKQVKLNRQSLIRDTQALFSPLLKAIEQAGSHAGIFVTNRIAAVPELFKQLNHSLILDEDAIARNSLTGQADICPADGRLGFVTALPRQLKQDTPEVSPTEDIPTHVLWHNRAYPIADRSVYLSALPELMINRKAETGTFWAIEPVEGGLRLAQQSAEATPVMVNGLPGRHHQLLTTGDKLTIGGRGEAVTLLRLIEDEHW